MQRHGRDDRSDPIQVIRWAKAADSGDPDTDTTFADPPDLLAVGHAVVHQITSEEFSRVSCAPTLIVTGAQTLVRAGQQHDGFINDHISPTSLGCRILDGGGDNPVDDDEQAIAGQLRRRLLGRGPCG